MYFASTRRLGLKGLFDQSVVVRSPIRSDRQPRQQRVIFRGVLQVGELVYEKLIELVPVACVGVKMKLRQRDEIGFFSSRPSQALWQLAT